jgi:hypothetical protein
MARMILMTTKTIPPVCIQARTLHKNGFTGLHSPGLLAKKPVIELFYQKKEP